LDHVGETGHTFRTKHNGKPLYVISLDEEFDGKIKVLQPEEKSDLEARIEALEKEVYKNSKFENKENNDKKTKSGPAEIRTQDLHLVEALDSGNFS
jgi:hypothetical protein